jgi:hypothetical protein
LVLAFAAVVKARTRPPQEIFKKRFSDPERETMNASITTALAAALFAAELKPTAAHQLVATGVELEKGAEAVAAVQTGAGKDVTVRFTSL